MPSYVLRDYQKECVDLVNGLPDGCRTVVALATGLGKTLVGASLDFKGRVLWLSHRDELVRQPEKYFKARGMSFGIEKAGEHADGEDVISASVQSLYHDSRLESFPKDAFDTIIVDEAHHAAAPTYKKILSYFTPRKVIGLTATPGRGDGVRLTDVFDSICFSRNIAWGITHGYLADIRCLRVSGGFDLSGVDMSGGDYTAASLERAMDESENAETVACAYMDSCRPKQLRTLVYCPTRRICQEVADAIKKKIPDKEQETVRVLTGEDPADVRSQALADFRKGKPDREQLYQDLRDILQRYGDTDIAGIDIADFFMDVMDAMKKNRITMPHGLTMLARGLTHMEGDLAEISPDINMAEIASQRIQASYLKSFDWKEALSHSGQDLFHAARDSAKLPSLMSRIMKEYLNGQSRVNLELKTSKNFAWLLRKLVQNIVIGMWVVALLISSSILCLTDMHPKILGMPLLGFLGYSAAGVIVLFLVIRHFATKPK